VLGDVPSKGNRMNVRSNAPGVGYRSTGRAGLGVSTPGGPAGSVNSIFLNSELKAVISNNNRKTRGNANSLTMPPAGPSAVAKSFNNTTYNLNGQQATNNFGVGSGANNHKLVRYKNSGSRNIASPTGQTSASGIQYY
jgi:hypothetical protein